MFLTFETYSTYEAYVKRLYWMLVYAAKSYNVNLKFGWEILIFIKHQLII